MPLRLKHYLNRTILVSIPALFEDGKCREYILESIEADGLWLNAEALATRLLPEHEKTVSVTKPIVFVPATQIAAIILPPPAAKPVDTAAAPGPAKATTNPPA